GVAEGAGDVGLLTIGVLLLDLAALHRGDEVGEDVFGLQRLRRGHLFSVGILDLDLAPGAGVDEATLTGDHHGDAALSFELIGGLHALGPFFLPRLALGQTAGFKDQRSLVVVVVNELSVRGLGVVLVAEAAADAHGARGDLVFAEIPAGHIHLVDALVAHVP